MKMLGTSHSRLFTCKGIPQERAILCSRELTFPCNGYHKRVGNCLPLAVSNDPKFFRSVFHASSSQTSVENEETQAENSQHHPETARVQFKLKKKCEFGQRFALVGDDPVLGLWNPSDGVALSWSDGDVWTADIDIPCGKVIKYKFILMSDATILSWQPGSDRSLETSNSEKTIIVFEGWDDNPQLQNMFEEELDTDFNAPLSINGSSSFVACSENQSVLGKEGDDVERVSNADDQVRSDQIPPAPIMADSHATKETTAVVTVEQDGGTSSGNDGEQTYGSSFSDYKDEEWLDSDDGVTVPVPGLAMPQERITGAEEENHYAIENTIKTNNPTDNESRAQELGSSGSMHPVEFQEQSVYAKEQLERDLQWGKRTLLKFLENFGLQ